MLEKIGAGGLSECPNCGGELDSLGSEWESEGILMWSTQCSECGKSFEEEFHCVKWKEVA